MSSVPASAAMTGKERRDLAVASLVLVAFVGLLLAAYFAAPPAEVRLESIWATLVLSLGAIAALVVLYLRSLRRVRGARRPIFRSIALVIVALTTFVVLFSYAYLSLQVRSPGQMPGLQTHLDALYFTATLISTVGFGDIAPAGQAARSVATVQMLFNLIFLGNFVRLAVTIGQEAREDRRQAAISPGRGGAEPSV